MRGVYKSVGTEESKWIGKILAYWSEREREIIYIYIYISVPVLTPLILQRENILCLLVLGEYYSSQWYRSVA